MLANLFRLLAGSSGPVSFMVEANSLKCPPFESLCLTVRFRTLRAICALPPRTVVHARVPERATRGEVARILFAKRVAMDTRFR
jgi:hypothetical protein